MVEVGVDGVGDVLVGEGEGVGVLAQGGRCVGVAEPGLGLEDLAAADQEGRHRVPEPVQGRVRDAGGVAECGEPVSEDFGAEAVVVASIGGEQPRTELPLDPGLLVCDESVPHAAVEAPMVIDRPRPDFGVVTMPAETALSIRRVRPTRSAIRRAVSSPRRAPVSAARRTRSRSSSAR